MELFAELDATEGWPPERWAAILERIAKLFLCSLDSLSAHQVDLFDNVFVRLTHRVDTPSLATLSRKLSEATRTLPQVTRRLALDENESVAIPMLKSRDIAQALLLEAVQSCGSGHRLAIASRTSINPPVSEALVQCGPSPVHHALAENRGAKMSEAGWARLVELGGGDIDLGGKLARRTDIPAPLKRKLHAKLEDARMRALHARPRVVREQIEGTVAAKAATGTLPDPEPSDLARVQATMLELNRKGKLKDSTINRFAAGREYVEVAAALALLTGSPIEVIRALIAGDKVEGLVLACKAARLTWATTGMIVKNRPGMPALSAGELEKAKETFESFCLSAAQLTVRF
jgi:uncharacterized protein (DUF2336 family)